MDAAANGKPIPLDDDGDLVVVVRGIDRSRSRSFLVSSRMLRLASRVFATMLGPRYQEGRQLQEAREKSAADQQPTITLEEDDLDAMDFIFSNIHFKSGRIVKKFTASAIAHIAIQSDKYDCNAALVPWIRLWCDPDQFPVSFTNPVRDMGYGLLAAYLFQSPKFDMMSAKFVEKLPSDFAASWKAYKFLSQLPKIVRDKLACEIRHTQNAIRLMVLSKLTDLYLGEFSPEFSDFDTDTEYAYCSCGLSHPARYLNALIKLGIWPSLLPFETLSANKIVSTIQQLTGLPFAKEVPIGEPGCSFHREMHDLYESLSSIRDEMDGVPLHIVNQANDEDENEESE